MPVTIKDVARAAGVSVATVSRAVNGSSSILPETKLRVLQAAKSLRFIPSSAARSLITRRTDTIGALLPDLYGEYFSELIRGIDQAARARGLHLLVSSSHDDASEAAAAMRAMNGRVDGMLVMSPHADEAFLAHNMPTGLPAVFINSAVRLKGYPAFLVDNFGGAKTMTRHLTRLGHKRIAFIAGPPHNPEARDRLRGYRTGLSTKAKPLVFEGDFSEESGWVAGERILRSRRRVHAVFAANDMMAIGCIGAFAAAQVRVPEDIAVAGFDDIPIARYVAPALTTIHVPIAMLGAAALTTLAGAIESAEPASGATVAMPVDLVVRMSCGAPPREAPAAC